MMKDEMRFYEPQVDKNGQVSILFPYCQSFQPLRGIKYAHKREVYPVEDNEYGCNCLVMERYDVPSKRMIKQLMVDVPEEIIQMYREYDKETSSNMRKDDDHADKRPSSGYTDDNGDWHGGTMDEAAYADYMRSEEDPEEETFDAETLHGSLSDHANIKNAQIHEMCQIIATAIHSFPPQLQQTFEDLFGFCEKEVDVAHRDGVEKSAITNRKNRLIAGMREILVASGFAAPTKAELKAEKNAIEKRNQHLDEAYAKELEEAKEQKLAYELTELFYREGILDQKACEQIEKEIEEAA